MKSLGNALPKIIQDLTSYDPKDIRLPTVICSTCRINIYRASKVSDAKIKLPDYSCFTFPTKVTRSTSNKNCECTLCILARKNAVSDKTKNKMNSKKKIRKVQKKSRKSYVQGVFWN